MELSEVDVSMKRGLCSIGRTLELIGDRWSLLILREISFYDVTRFEQLRSSLDISRAVLSERLDGLVGHGLLERVPYHPPGERIRHEYRLTGAGAELFPILVAIMHWGDKHRNEAAAPIELTHAGCGARVGLQLRCEQGHAVEQAAVVPAPGPGLKRRRAHARRLRESLEPRRVAS